MLKQLKKEYKKRKVEGEKVKYVREISNDKRKRGEAGCFVFVH